MAQVLRINDGERWQIEDAFEVLGEYAGLYGDNGGDTEGNAWLPLNTDVPIDLAQKVVDAGLGRMAEVSFVPIDLAQKVVDAGLGRMAEVCFASQEDILNLLGFASVNEDWGDELIEMVAAALAAETNGWAHLGAYNTPESIFVFERLPAR